jgi:type VI secretion system protein
MGLCLHILGTGAQAGRDNRVEMTGAALSVGRGEANDLVLPDPERMISSQHCVLENRGGEYVVLDVSTNGTFLNFTTDALGNVPTPLNNGDTLSIGGYELRVEISAQATSDPFADLPPPMEDAPLIDARAAAAPAAGDILSALDVSGQVDGDLLEDLLGEAPPNAMNRPDPLIGEADTGEMDDFLGVAPDPFAEGGASEADHSASANDFFQPSASAGQMIPDDWDDDLTGGGADDPLGGPMAAPVPPPVPAPAQVAPKPTVQTPASAPAKQTPPQQPAPAAAVAPQPVAQPAPASAATSVAAPAPELAARAFLKAAGAEGLAIDDAELVEIMTRLGAAFRTMVEGTREVLMTRKSIKDEFRLGQTMISPDGNNPIKFSISPQQAMEAMIKPTIAGYQPAEKAATEALNDIKAHEVAMMTGMESALKALLRRFDPESLASRMEQGSALGNLLKGKKARYWEVFEKMYGEISTEAEDDFNSLFGKEFAKAYQDQIRKL